MAALDEIDFCPAKFILPPMRAIAHMMIVSPRQAMPQRGTSKGLASASSRTNMHRARNRARWIYAIKRTTGRQVT